MTQPLSSERTTFRSPWTARIPGALLASALIVGLGIWLIPTMLPITMPRAGRAALSLTVVVILLLIVWGAALWQRNVRVIVTSDAVVVRRPFQTLHTWDRARTSFTTSVVENRTNGVRSSSTRTLTAHTPGVSSSVTIAGISRAKFNELYALLVPATEVISPPVAAELPTRALSAAPAVFATDRGVFATSARRMLITAFLFLAAGVVVSLLGSLPGVVDDQILLVILGSFAFLLGLIFLAVGLWLNSRARRIPARIEVTAGGIDIDDTLYPFAQLRRITLSPPSYTGRRLSLTPLDGRARTVLLGLQDARPGTEILVNYPELVHAISSRTASFPGLVTVDLA